MGILVDFQAAHRAKQARERKGLYQYQLGRQINVSESYICRIERGGKSVEPEILAALVRLLNLDPTDFCKNCPLHNVNDPGAA